MTVRIALLLVSLPLLAFGAEGIFQALRGGRDGTPIIPAFAAVAGALALLVWLFLSMEARRRARVFAEPEETADPIDVAPEDAPSTPSRLAAAIPPPTREFRRLMLVNLSPYAAVSALENAPPIGAQAAVRAALAQVLPGITFNDHGVGHFNASDHTILVDLGVEPQVWAATIDVVGEAAPIALRRLITQTGWRAYAPKLGRFITAEDLKA